MARARLAAVLFSGLLLSACATLRPAPELPLEGVWAPDRGACGGDETFAVRGDVLLFDGETHRFTRKGRELRFEDGHRVVILDQAPDSLRWRAADGSVLDYVRCAA